MPPVAMECSRETYWLLLESTVLVLLLTLLIYGTQLISVGGGMPQQWGWWPFHCSALVLPAALFPWVWFISSLLGSAGWAACSGWWWCLQRALWGEHGCPRRYRWWWVPRSVPFPWRCQWGCQCCLSPPWAYAEDNRPAWDLSSKTFDRWS